MIDHLLAAYAKADHEDEQNPTEASWAAREAAREAVTNAHQAAIIAQLTTMVPGDGLTREELTRRSRSNLVDIVLAQIGQVTLLQRELAEAEMKNAQLTVKCDAFFRASVSGSRVE